MKFTLKIRLCIDPNLPVMDFGSLCNINMKTMNFLSILKDFCINGFVTRLLV